MSDLKDAGKFAELLELTLRLGASDATVISTSEIRIEDELARLCVEPQCENYGASANCPPHVSGPEGFRELLKVYEQAVVYKLEVPSPVLFSPVERLEVFGLLQEISASVELAAVKIGQTRSKGFAGSCCKILFCSDHPRCRVLHEGGKCRNPQLARPSMSGFGINVSKLMQSAGWSLQRAGGKTIDTAVGTLCGLILIG
ncbi:MAG: DUF2284 domain-containing protein [Syntrophobacteraceae bacterium]|nr:DUF2284 domain-containing protein [Syntrophobacteraceae bacterium]